MFDLKDHGVFKKTKISYRSLPMYRDVILYNRGRFTLEELVRLFRRFHEDEDIIQTLQALDVLPYTKRFDEYKIDENNELFFRSYENHDFFLYDYYF